MEAAANNWRQRCLKPFEVPAENVEAARRQFLERVSSEPSAPRWRMSFRIGLAAGALACGVMAAIGVWTVRERELAPVPRPVPAKASGIRLPAEL